LEKLQLGTGCGEKKRRVPHPRRHNDRYLFEVLPRVYGQFPAFRFYRWEVMMRESAILGIPGIHTLSFYIDSAKMVSSYST
jgi:phosphonate transport system permease protein